MKKIIGSLVVITLVVLNLVAAPAKVSANVDPGASVDCYGQYDDGTTHFVYCWNCSSVSGKNPGLLDKCKP